VRTIAVYNLKGGVGKTATAVNLAWLSARAGARTLLWDLDAQGAATYYFRVKPKIRGGLGKLLRGTRPIERQIRATDQDGLDLLPSDFSYRNLELELDRVKNPTKRLRKLVRPLGRDYDHLFLDCAPSISLVSEGVFRAADALLVPTIPTTLSLRTLDQLRRHLHEHGQDDLTVLPFWSMVDRRKGSHRDVSAREERKGLRFLRTQIPYSSQVESMGVHRAPLHTFAPNCPAAGRFEELWHELLLRTGSWFDGLFAPRV
jgi:cellulose biosynthesis protein BcsQ